jgi:hypothetical protein
VSALADLAAAARQRGGLLAAAVDESGASAPAPHGATAAAGPRAAADPADYALLVEAIREGYLLHYGTPRVVVPDDRDLALLAGDALFALGLARLAQRGDLEAVAVLADVISLAAQAQAAAQPALAEAIWDAGAVAVGWGADKRWEAAVAAARTGDPASAAALAAYADARS